MKTGPITHITGFLTLHPWRITAAVLLGAGTILAGVGLLSSSGYLISAAALQPPILDLMVIIVSVRFFGISRAALRYGERIISHDITFRLLMMFRVRFFHNISRLPAGVLQGYRSGSLLSSVTSDIDELQNYYVRVFSPAIVALLVSLLTFLFLNGFSAPAARIMLILLFLNGVAVPVITRYLARGYGEKQLCLRSRLSELWIEHIQGFDDIRLFGLRSEKQKKLLHIVKELRLLESKQAFITGLQDTLSNWLMYIAVFLSLMVTVPLVVGGALSGVMVALVLLGVMASFEATQNLGTAFQYLESTEKSARRLLKLQSRIRDSEEEARPGSGARDESPKNASKAHIRFSGVTFGYDGRPVLRDVTFDLPATHHMAVVGPTGGGKSTIFNLLLRFHDHDEGSIYLSGKNLVETSPDDVRAKLSVVDQNTYIFHDTLRNNLLLAQNDATDQQLAAALEQAGLHEWFIKLEHGLSTVLDEHGGSVSGGERQRLAIARALLKESEIWLLDEPTANLDTITEKALVQTIQENIKNKTVIWVTHRLVEMFQFDDIVVLGEGKIVQRGRHEKLLQQEGWYRSMIALQNDVLPDK
ncbi:thiol reductant ABC exporter subunit CydC [Balneolales bacterium ANBcel1]|nr:thiol reductant ABC exporter subunit CydC [Balneolales bacterium ANBcel1]